MHHKHHWHYLEKIKPETKRADISRYTLIIVAKFIQQRNNYTLFNFRIVAKKIKYNSMQLEVYYH